MTTSPCARIVLVLAAAACAATGSASAQEVSFKGQKINVIIGNAPGGGTDGTTRHVGKFLEKYLPGNPQMVFRNIPAGAGVQATNYLANEARRDGTYWAGGASNYISAATVGKEVAQYDPTTFEFIGGIERGGSILILRKSKLADLTDRSKPPAVAGTTDGSPSWTMLALWGADVLGWNVRFIVGYPGTAALQLAARRGEIDVFGTSNLRMLSDLRGSGEFVGMAQDGQMEGGKFVPRSDIADVPTIAALVEGKLSGIPREAFDFWNKANQIDKWYALPPGTPPAVVKVYRAAFLEAGRDPEFIRLGRAQFGEDFRLQSGEDMTDVVKATAKPRPEILVYQRQLKTRYGLPEERLSDEQMAKLAKALVKSVKLETKLTRVEKDGRLIVFPADGGEHKAELSGSRSKVTIAGAAAKRAALQAGMACSIAYAGDGGEVETIECR